MAGESGSAFSEEMVEAVGVGVAIYGGDGRYRYVNDAYADLLGTDREALVGRALWDVNPSLERERFADYWASFADGETRTAETEHEFAGTCVPVTTVTTRRSIDGTPYHFGTIRDITERRARERELERQNERLDSFAGIVSHDLRNPLGVAKAYLDIAREERESAELDMVGSALDRMEILVGDLLTLARKGVAVEDPEPVSLRGVATAAWRSVDTGEAAFEATTDRLLLASESRLQQLLENLYRNAVEHGSADGSLTVRVGPLEAGADAGAGFYVADDGPGIPAEDRDAVFAAGETTHEDGTGFGLAIVKGIAEAHGWTVELTESAAGGARFEFTGVAFEG
ncbi:PAS domain-containing sensor histidine kinase [Salinirubellus salinus]|uniref:histidine kinase n=1 Tax=Salinirubellus salinus TaxID=1364945 RepID=A0A9E7R1Q9_9EURY|nr:PAS domain-containing sensor histidine kinase [Salinirubellus salinus]UWM54140.1 PAS domain-containing sensor histidine kinase [Salinirubellus salinus]